MKFVIPDPENPIVGNFQKVQGGRGIVHKCRQFQVGQCSFLPRIVPLLFTLQYLYSRILSVCCTHIQSNLVNLLVHSSLVVHAQFLAIGKLVLSLQMRLEIFYLLKVCGCLILHTRGRPPLDMIPHWISQPAKKGAQFCDCAIYNKL